MRSRGPDNPGMGVVGVLGACRKDAREVHMYPSDSVSRVVPYIAWRAREDGTAAAPPRRRFAPPPVARLRRAGCEPVTPAFGETCSESRQDSGTHLEAGA